MSETKPIRHRYPIWLAGPLEIGACAIVVATVWNCFQTALRVLLQQWPDALRNIDAVPYAKAIVMLIVGQVPAGPLPWEKLYPSLLNLSAWAAVFFFLAAVLRNFLPSLRVLDKGLQVRRGLGWVTIPWERITQVQNMSLGGERLVLLIQGKRWRLGPWFRLYSLLWGAGLKKGIVVAWHLSDFDTFAAGLVERLQGVYGAEEMELVVDDTAYSFFYALLFLPRAAWAQLTAARQPAAIDAFAHPRWLRMAVRGGIVLLLALAIWRYLGVWWRFLAGTFPDLLSVLQWPVLGDVLKLFGRPDMALFSGRTPLPAWPSMALLLGQVSMILVLAAVAFLQGLFPDWVLGAEGPSASFRKRWLPVKWTAIRSVRETVPHEGKGIVLVQVRWPALTFWHTLYSLFYGAGLRRAVLFSSLLPGFEDLRQRIQAGVSSSFEKAARPPEKPILVKDGESDHLLMLLAPRSTLRRWGNRPEPEPAASAQGGGLLKKPGTFSAGGEMPWEGRQRWPLFEGEEEEEEKVSLRDLGLPRAIGAAATLIAFPPLLILLEELLYPPLCRGLALFSLGATLPAHGFGRLVLLAVVMALLTLGEAPFTALLTTLVAEMYERPVRFLPTLLLYPRIQSVRAVLGLGVLMLGATGMVQPLFLLWWIGSLVWGAILMALAGRETHGWEGWGFLLVPAGHVLYQALILLVYFLLR